MVARGEQGNVQHRIILHPHPQYSSRERKWLSDGSAPNGKGFGSAGVLNALSSDPWLTLVKETYCHVGAIGWHDATPNPSA
jgi:hypothetical protein